MNRTLLQMALQHLAQSWRQIAALLLMFSISTMLALVTSGYNASLKQIFGEIGQEYLVVQAFNRIGELGGSRISPAVRHLLVAQGVTEIIPEIHTAVGVSLEQVIQFRGISPADYRKTVEFELLEGEAIDEQTPTRQVMLGWRLAERLKAHASSVIQLRGRDFQVLGVFRMRTYADNEAWVTISDAQALLGWGEDVSIYLIPNDGLLHPGDSLGNQQSGQAEVVRRGVAVEELTGPVLDYLALVTQVALVSCGLTLGVVLLRLAWTHRRELAILYSLGFPLAILGRYLMIQAVMITLCGSLLGSIGAWLAGSLANLQAAGYTIPLLLDWRLLAQNAAWLAVITLGGTALPALWLYRLEPDQLLRVE